MMMRENLLRGLKELDDEIALADPEDLERAIDEMLQVIDSAGYWLITKDRYSDWKRDVRLLAALEAAGVDNWEGWNEVIQSVEEGQ